MGGESTEHAVLGARGSSPHGQPAGSGRPLRRQLPLGNREEVAGPVDFSNAREVSGDEV